MRLLKTESFDRFGRYSHVWQLRPSIDRRPIKILDVGDPYGLLGRLFDDFTVSVDFLTDVLPGLEDHAHVQGSGTLLPFRDGAFDVVTSHDALEHVPHELRLAFIDELLRVSAGPVLLVHPVADVRTERAEEIVNGYYTARFGSGIDQLEEHRAASLPDLAWLEAELESRGVSFASWGDGWLFSWLAFMLIKAHHVSENKLDVDRLIDIACNELLRDVDARAPHYRRVLLLRPPTGFEPPEVPVSDRPPEAEAALLMELAAGLTESLPRGRDVLTDGSPLRSWIARSKEGGGPIAAAAVAVETAIDAAGATEGAEAPEEAAVSAAALPSVAVVVVNLDGAEHLETFLPSVEALEYPRDLLEVVVVDNGSRDGSLELLASHDVRVLAQEQNIGFAPAVNAGVAASTSECVVFLNNDMRVEPDFLLRLVDRYSPDDGVTCVAAQILSWDGERVDFIGSAMNFYGMGTQTGYGSPTTAVAPVAGTRLLFACGGAMLVSRQAFQEVGGFDDAYFAYFEDVDLGWRLNLAGHHVVFAPEARCFHRMHGTSSRFPYHQRLFLYERNALMSIVKNYEAQNLPKVLAAALLLLAKRAAVAGQLDRAPFRIGGDREPSDDVPRLALAGLMAINDLIDQLDEVMARRDRVQQLRRVDDAALFDLFGHPFLPTELALEATRAEHAIIRSFGLDRLLRKERGSHVLVVTGELVGKKMRGPAIRALEIARALAGTVTATLAVPQEPDEGFEAEGIDVRVYHDGRTLSQLAASADLVIVQGYSLRRHPELREVEALLVADLYDPWLFEAMEVHRGAPWGNEAVHQDVSVLNELLDEADLFICASERQRDYWMGMLTARGRIDQTRYEHDDTLRDLVGVVPFGLPARPPRHVRQVLKGVHPAVGAEDPVVLWGGGAWDWFDPVSVIEAFAIVVQRIPNAKLYFLGLQLLDGNVDVMDAARRAVETAEALGLSGTSVIFGDWAAYEEREAFLIEADVAISAARDLAETRLAFRSRLLDAFWAGVPVVTTSGDVLADQVREAGAGLVVSPGDVTGLADAMIRLLSDPVLRSSCAGRSLDLSHSFRWTQAVEPLRRTLDAPWRHLEARRRRPGRKTQTSNIVIRQLRDSSEHFAKLELHASTAERLYKEQLERAELHLSEVKDLLVVCGDLRRDLEEAGRRITELEDGVRARDVELHRLRTNPAVKALLRARQAQHRLTADRND